MKRVAIATVKHFRELGIGGTIGFFIVVPLVLSWVIVTGWGLLQFVFSMAGALFLSGLLLGVCIGSVRR